tara:strand:+ start:480 stop:1121 length:642 start_codon:yes stop_codon:yes gene_type:complete
MIHNFKHGDILYHANNPGDLIIFIGSKFTMADASSVVRSLITILDGDVNYHHEKLRFLCRAENFHLFTTQWYIDMSRYRGDDEFAVYNHLKELGFTFELSGSTPVVIRNTQLSCIHEGVYGCIRDIRGDIPLDVPELKLNLTKKVVVENAKIENRRKRRLEADLKLANERRHVVDSELESLKRKQDDINKEIGSLINQLAEIEHLDQHEGNKQ